jgi:ribosomal protein S21
VTHAYNPSYSGGRDQEDQGSKPAQANSLGDSILKKKIITKKGLVEWFKVKALNSSPSTEKKKKKKKKKKKEGEEEQWDTEIFKRYGQE